MTMENEPFEKNLPISEFCRLTYYTREFLRLIEKKRLIMPLPKEQVLLEFFKIGPTDNRLVSL